MRFLAIFLNVLVLLLALLVGVSWLVGDNLVCELVLDLLPVESVFLAILVLTLALLRQRSAVLGVIVLIAVSFPVVQLFIPANKPCQNETLRFLQMNLWGGKNREYAKVVAVVKAENADIVGFSEITSPWLTQLKLACPEYKYVIAEPQAGGIALFSKQPLTGQIRYFSNRNRPRVVAQSETPIGKVNFVFMHPFIPIKGLMDARNQELAECAEEARNLGRPIVLAGDLNSTPWSACFRALKKTGNLSDSECGFGPQPSWSVFMPLRLFPIDHCLVSADLVVRERRTLGETGSDHLPVLVVLSRSK